MKVTKELKQLIWQAKMCNIGEKNPLQYIHVKERFDFEKDFTIISGENSFTLNSLKKQVSDISGKRFVVVLINTITWDNGSRKEINYCGISENFDEFYPVKSCESYGIGTYYAKKCFERDRKATNSHLRWFLLYQDKEHLASRKKHYYDKNDRILSYTDKNGWKRNTQRGIISYAFTNWKEIEYNRSFDKSGYNTSGIKGSYKVRLSTLKRERKQKQAENESYKYIESAKIIKTNAENLRLDIIELLNNSDYEKLSEIFESYKGYASLMKGINRHIENLENKIYSSVDRIQSEESCLLKQYNNIVDIIIR